LDSILAALALGAASFGFYRWNKRRDAKWNKRISPRRRALAGVWKGEATGIISERHLAAGVLVYYVFQVHPRSGAISATSYYESLNNPGRWVRDQHHGELHHEHYLLLEYAKENKISSGFGSVVLRLDGDVEQLDGYAVGYGNEISGLYSCQVKLKKMHSPLPPDILKNPGLAPA
jgi:hypothetical protein